MKGIKKIRGKKNDINIVMNYNWPVQYYALKEDNEDDYILSIEESVVLCNLPMMYGLRYDKDIDTEYDKAILGYKNWKDFCKRSMKFFTNKEVILNEYKVLLGMITKLFNRLMNESIIDGDYVVIFNWIAIGLRLYYVKGFDFIHLKIRLMESEYYNEEISRLVDILSKAKSWHCQLLNEIVAEEMSERFYHIKSGYEV